MTPKKKTTKQVLAEALNDQPRTPLYNPAALSELQQAFDTWQHRDVRPADRENWQSVPQMVLGSRTPRDLLYTPLSNPEFDYGMDLGNSGEPPFTRGVHANMYRGRAFTRRQLAGYGSPEDTNERIKFLLDHGATGISIIFDLPTIQMYDSDDPVSTGQVGMSGVAIDSVEDMDLLFKDIALDEVTVSLVSHYPSNSAILFPMYLALARRRGIPWDKLKGSIQNDITLEEVVRSGPEYIPPQDCFRIQCDNIEFIRQEVPLWNFMTINGYNLREFGTSAVTEMAVALANAIETLETLQARGHDADWLGRRLAFFWSIGNDFFEEVARIRAVRRLWHRIMKYRFGARDLRATWMRCHVQTSGVSLTRQEPLNNVVRAGYHALAAVLGGVQSLHVDSFDEAYSVPTEEAALLSLRTQQILQEETGVTQVADPLGGSFYVEALTDEMERRILAELDEIEKLGGYVATIKEGWIHRKISDFFRREREQVESGRIRVVAENIYQTKADLPPVNVFRYPEGAAQRQHNRLEKLRKNRDNQQVDTALEALEAACRGGANILPRAVACAEAGCSEGELFTVFKRAFGLWKPPVLW
ncbi:MAG: acyl-CoA mutase large subunit family protein [Deltaproteobacteria bacterium]|jgi:methylmalonyl-CoA mutase N-terminal domain/subunit|nr:acyl-CoA mutase large subunit family protein [Deltaproteobacteria bacterium]MBW2479462.1 acyl-CoA mutase large subunit family protein [Deltaproteobacteria bacterium]